MMLQDAHQDTQLACLPLESRGEMALSLFTQLHRARASFDIGSTTPGVTANVATLWRKDKPASDASLLLSPLLSNLRLPLVSARL